MHKTDFHVLVRNKKGDITLCNLDGRFGNNRYMGSLTLTQDDLTPVQAEAVKENRQRYILNNENNATEFILALEDHFGDKQKSLEMAKAFNVSQSEIDKHFGDYLDACLDNEKDKAYNAWFFSEFLASQFLGCVELMGCVPSEFTSADESTLQAWEDAYLVEAKNKFAEMEQMIKEQGNAAYATEAYAMAKNRFQQMAKNTWIVRRRLGTA